MYFYYESCGHSPSPIPPTIPINSRSFLFGDHAYEVLRTYRHVPFAAEAHFERLLSSLTYLKYDIYPSFDTLCQDLFKILQYAYHTLHLTDELCIRYHFGRSEDNHIGLYPSTSLNPLWIYICAPLEFYRVRHDPKRGLRLGISPVYRHDPQSFSPNVKTGNYANNMLACIDAKNRGFDDAIFLHGQSRTLLEGSTFNIAFLDLEGTLVVPDPHTENRYLKGITLASLIDTQPNFSWKFEDISHDKLDKYPYCLALSTTREIQWIGAIESHVFKPIPEKFLAPLQTHFNKVIQADTEKFKGLLVRNLETSTLQR